MIVPSETLKKNKGAPCYSTFPLGVSNQTHQPAPIEQDPSFAFPTPYSKGHSKNSGSSDSRKLFVEHAGTKDNDCQLYAAGTHHHQRSPVSWTSPCS